MHSKCVLLTGGAGCPCWLLLLHYLYASGFCWVLVGALHRVLALQVLGWVLQAFFSVLSSGLYEGVTGVARRMVHP